MDEIRTSCCIAGGGPAGMMLGFLLARAGIDVVVLEKHADFLRDFRGDTIHPSTLEVMHELGLLEEFLKLPHQAGAAADGGIVGDTPVPDRRLLAPADALQVHRDDAAVGLPRFPGRQRRGAIRRFQLRMQAEVTGLIEESGRVAGVRATTPEGPLSVARDLVVGADGRGSIVRERAGLEVEDLGAPMDVLWMRLSRRPSDGAEHVGRFDAGQSS